MKALRGQRVVVTIGAPPPVAAVLSHLDGNRRHIENLVSDWSLDRTSFQRRQVLAASAAAFRVVVDDAVHLLLGE